jgi:hypothetical protein
MSHVTSNRALAEGLLKTIQRLESDPNVDPQESVFINLKRIMVKRLLTLEDGAAEIRASIHPRQAEPIEANEK